MRATVGSRTTHCGTMRPCQKYALKPSRYASAGPFSACRRPSRSSARIDGRSQTTATPWNGHHQPAVRAAMTRPSTARSESRLWSRDRASCRASSWRWSRWLRAQARVVRAWLWSGSRGRSVIWASEALIASIAIRSPSRRWPKAVWSQNAGRPHVAMDASTCARCVRPADCGTPASISGVLASRVVKARPRAAERMAPSTRSLSGNRTASEARCQARLEYINDAARLALCRAWTHTLSEARTAARPARVASTPATIAPSAGSGTQTTVRGWVRPAHSYASAIPNSASSRSAGSVHACTASHSRRTSWSS
nr:hypothetical protein [Catenulispora pinisilvae]